MTLSRLLPRASALLWSLLGFVLPGVLSGCGGGSSSSRSATAIKVACIGDSITQGAGTTNANLYSYPSVLSKRLGNGYSVQNYGVGGTTLLTEGSNIYRNQGFFRSAISFKPDIVVIGLGTNDSNFFTFTPEVKTRFLRDYRQLIADFKKVNPRVQIFTCLPPAFSPPRPESTLPSIVIPLIRQVAQETGATTIDLYAPLLDRPKLFADTLHPNNSGAAVVAETVQAAILAGTAAPTP
jgi:lysophospholipase L1-like esterase